MARKKNAELQDVAVNEQVGETVEQETVDEVVNEQETELKEPVEETDVEHTEELVEETLPEPSEFVLKFLKMYDNHPELYIDSKGGVYSESTQPQQVGNAILYKNPYYKS